MPQITRFFNRFWWLLKSCESDGHRAGWWRVVSGAFGDYDIVLEPFQEKIRIFPVTGAQISDPLWEWILYETANHSLPRENGHWCKCDVHRLLYSVRGIDAADESDRVLSFLSPSGLEPTFRRSKSSSPSNWANDYPLDSAESEDLYTILGHSSRDTSSALQALTMITLVTLLTCLVPFKSIIFPGFYTVERLVSSISYTLGGMQSLDTSS